MSEEQLEYIVNNIYEESIVNLIVQSIKDQKDDILAICFKHYNNPIYKLIYPYESIHKLFTSLKSLKSVELLARILDIKFEMRGDMIIATYEGRSRKWKSIQVDRDVFTYVEEIE